MNILLFSKTQEFELDCGSPITVQLYNDFKKLRLNCNIIKNVQISVSVSTIKELCTNWDTYILKLRIKIYKENGYSSHYHPYLVECGFAH